MLVEVRRVEFLEVVCTDDCSQGDVLDGLEFDRFELLTSGLHAVAAYVSISFMCILKIA